MECGFCESSLVEVKKLREALERLKGHVGRPGRDIIEEALREGE